MKRYYINDKNVSKEEFQKIVFNFELQEQSITITQYKWLCNKIVHERFDTPPVKKMIEYLLSKGIDIDYIVNVITEQFSIHAQQAPYVNFEKVDDFIIPHEMAYTPEEYNELFLEFQAEWDDNYDDPAEWEIDDKSGKPTKFCIEE